MLAVLDPGTVRSAQARRWVLAWMVTGAGVLMGVVLAALALRSLYIWFALAAGLYVVGAAIILARPRWSLHLIVFFSLIGDPQVMPWYPFTKNASSGESLLFVDERLFFSPQEGYITVAIVALLLHSLLGHHMLRIRTPLFRATVLFGGFAFLAFVWGMARGGWLAVAVGQSRGLIAVPVLYLLFVNLLERPHIRGLLWTAMTAVFLKSVYAIVTVYVTEADQVAVGDLGVGGGSSPVTHSASIQMNLVFLVLATAVLFHGMSRQVRLVVPFLLVPVVWLTVLAERRAGIGALLIAGGLLLVVLARRNVRRFLVLAPPLVLVFLGYTAAFWNSESTVAFPAQAVKSQLVGTDEADSSSDRYREIENLNLVLMIKNQPLLGTGFGHPMTEYYQLPDISGVFPLYAFFPHNSTLYLWTAGGVFVFASYVGLLFVAIREGVQAALRESEPDAVLGATLGLGLVSMVAVYSYLDISWDPQTIVVFALGLGLIGMLRGTEDEAADEGGVGAAEGSAELRREPGHVGV